MSYFATIDAAGRVTAFYHQDIHGAAIPDGAVPISDATHAAWILDTARQRWNGEALEPYEPPPAPAAVPSSVTARQARLALHAAGLLSEVEAAIATAGGAVQIEWEYATMIERASPLVAAISGPDGLDLPEAVVDALFIQAAGL